MATPVVPAAPATPATPAAAAPAAAPATPAPVAAPPPPAPAAAPAAPAAAAPEPAAAPATPAPAAAAPAGPPKSSDYPQTAEGIEEYVEAMEAYRKDHPDEAASAEEQARRDATAPQAGAQPEEAPRPAEVAPKPAEQPAAPAAAPATPQAMEELLGRNPALKAALDASPADREVLMETARAAEAAKPVLDLVPTVEEAKFALANSGQFLSLQHKFAMADEMPELGEQGFNEFLDLFKVVDDKGQPVMENGSPVMAPSFDFLSRKLVDGAVGSLLKSTKAQLDALNQKLGSFVYPSEEAKSADRVEAVNADYAIKAIDFVSALLSEGDGTDELPELPDDATPAQKEFQRQLQEQQQKLAGAKQASSREARVAARRAYELEVNGAHGKGVGDYVENDLKARRDRGEFIPDFLVEKAWIDPKTGQATKFPAYAVEIFNEFNAKIHSIPTVDDKLKNLELQGAPAKQMRLDYLAKLRSLYLPKIIDAYWDKVNQGLRKQGSAQAAQQSAVAQVARVEPQTQATPSAPAPLKGEELEQKAMDNLKDTPEWKQAGRVERDELLMVERERLRAGGR